MNLAGLLIAGLSLVGVTQGVSVTDKFDTEARRVDVIEMIHGNAVQSDSNERGSNGNRVDVIESIGSQGPGSRR